MYAHTKHMPEPVFRSIELGDGRQLEERPNRWSPIFSSHVWMSMQNVYVSWTVRGPPFFIAIFIALCKPSVSFSQCLRLLLAAIKIANLMVVWRCAPHLSLSRSLFVTIGSDRNRSHVHCNTIWPLTAWNPSLNRVVKFNDFYMVTGPVKRFCSYDIYVIISQWIFVDKKKEYLRVWDRSLNAMNRMFCSAVPV